MVFFSPISATIEVVVVVAADYMDDQSDQQDGYSIDHRFILFLISLHVHVHFFFLDKQYIIIYVTVADILPFKKSEMLFILVVKY